MPFLTTVKELPVKVITIQIRFES